MLPVNYLSPYASSLAHSDRLWCAYLLYLTVSKRRRNCVSPIATPITKERKTISIHEKLDVIKRLERGTRIPNICRVLAFVIML